jgi:flagellar biosynthesis protein FliR
VIDAAAFTSLGLLLVRPGMVVASAPVFGGSYVPPQVRIGLAVLLGILIAPAVPAPATLGTVGLVIAVAGEAVIGMSIGFTMRVLIGAAELAGYLASFQIGLSYAAIVDPQSGVRNNVLSMLYGSIALLVFLGIDAHHALIRALVDSYAMIPVGAAGLGDGLGRSVVELLGLIFVTGVRLAMPVVTVLVLVELALGLITRAAPALNLMVVGAPIRLLVGLLALAVGIMAIPPVVRAATTPMLEAASRLLRTFN